MLQLKSLFTSQAGSTMRSGEKVAGEDKSEALWGRQPSRVVAIGLSEDPREHQARLRRYLCYYLKLLCRTGDCETLLSAVGYLRRLLPSQPTLSDILRCMILFFHEMFVQYSVVLKHDGKGWAWELMICCKKPTLRCCI